MLPCSKYALPSGWLNTPILHLILRNSCDLRPSVLSPCLLNKSIARARTLDNVRVNRRSRQTNHSGSAKSVVISWLFLSSSGHIRQPSAVARGRCATPSATCRRTAVRFAFLSYVCSRRRVSNSGTPRRGPLQFFLLSKSDNYVGEISKLREPITNNVLEKRVRRIFRNLTNHYVTIEDTYKARSSAKRLLELHALIKNKRARNHYKYQKIRFLPENLREHFPKCFLSNYK